MKRGGYQKRLAKRARAYQPRPRPQLPPDICPMSRKHIYADKTQAEAAAARHTAAQYRTTFRVYPCLFGKHWHLTTQEQRGKAA